MHTHPNRQWASVGARHPAVVLRGGLANMLTWAAWGSDKGPSGSDCTSAKFGKHGWSLADLPAPRPEPTAHVAAPLRLAGRRPNLIIRPSSCLPRTNREGGR